MIHLKPPLLKTAASVKRRRVEDAHVGVHGYIRPIPRQFHSCNLHGRLPAEQKPGTVTFTAFMDGKVSLMKIKQLPGGGGPV